MNMLFYKKITEYLKSTTIYKNFINSLKLAPLYDPVDFTDLLIDNSDEKDIIKNSETNSPFEKLVNNLKYTTLYDAFDVADLLIDKTSNKYIK